MTKNVAILKLLANAERLGARKVCVSAKCLTLSLLILSSVQTMTYAADQSLPQLQLQQGTIDDTKKEPALLNGNIEKTDVIDGNRTDETGSPSKSKTGEALSDDQNPLFGETKQTENEGAPRVIILNGKTQQDLGELLNSTSGLFKFFLGKSGFSPVIELGKREPQLSPEEYRKMEYGVIGLDAVLQLGGPGPVVTRVYPGTPAEAAGIRRGDLIVKARDHVFQPGEGQRVLWQLVAGRAGTPVDISVLRNGEVRKFEMLRMNIEDIPDKSKRRQYELLLSALGAPHYDSDGDLSDSAAKDANDLNRLGRFLSKKKLNLYQSAE